MLHVFDEKSIWRMSGVRQYSPMQGLGNLVFVKRIILSFLQKKSDVLTETGEVIYRRRKLTLFGLRKIRFIDYHIQIVTSVIKETDNSLLVQGDIDAVYLFKDGVTEYTRKNIKDVLIPACYTDMQGIMSALDNIRMRGQDIP